MKKLMIIASSVAVMALVGVSHAAQPKPVQAQSDCCDGGACCDGGPCCAGK